MPIGTILPYTGDLNKIPHGWFLCDGSNGTPELHGRFLQGGDVPGQFIEAGLPNITGRFTQDSGGDRYVCGAFWIGDSVYCHTSSPSGDIDSIYNFDASRCSPIYGRSENVQPPAYTVYYIIRLA